MSPRSDLIAQWRAMSLRYNEIACGLERALTTSHDLSMSEFETLDRLAAADEDTHMRMQDLASAMYLSQSALSRTVARLEKAGLACRAMCEFDRRGVFVQITDDGRELHAKARQTHLDVLSDHLDD